MSALFAVCCVSKRHQETMNSFSNEEFDCHFLDEGFTAKDILDQKINEVSSSVSIYEVYAGSAALRILGR